MTPEIHLKNYRSLFLATQSGVNFGVRATSATYLSIHLIGTRL